MPLFTRCNRSLRCPQNMSEVSTQNTPQIIYYIILKMPILSGKQKHAVLVHVSLNANEPPFPE